jgi:hypothetical protein
VTEATSLLFVDMPTTSSRLLPVPALKLASVIWLDDDTLPDVDWILLKAIPDDETVPVVADETLDGELVPAEFIADTLYVYVVLGESPVSLYLVDAEPVLDTLVLHVEPPSVDLSIL